MIVFVMQKGSIMPRGEKRAGGRPPKSPEEVRQTLNCRVKGSTLSRLQEAKEKFDKSLGEIIDDLAERMPEDWVMSNEDYQRNQEIAAIYDAQADQSKARKRKSND